VLWSVLLCVGFDPAWWPGGDLLSRALRHSTMGAGAFHGRVRDGIGCSSLAMATGPPSRIEPWLLNSTDVVKGELVRGVIGCCVVSVCRGWMLRAVTF
jgi:hypothetical protein